MHQPGGRLNKVKHKIRLKRLSIKRLQLSKLRFTMTPPVWKMIYLARRNPQLAAADFPQAWREHSALGRSCSNVQTRVRSVAQCVRLLDAHWPATLHHGYDGVNLLHLSDRASADAIWHDRQTLAVMRPDEPRVFDRYVRDCALVAREQRLLAPPPADSGQANAVLLAFLKRRPGIDPAAWQHTLSQPTRPWPELGASAINWVEPERPPGYDYDAILEYWFSDAEQLTQALANAAATQPWLAQRQTDCDLAASVLIPTYISHRRP